MGVYKKDNRWYIDYYQPNGKRKREVVTISGIHPSNITRLDANKALNIRKAQMAEGKFEIAQAKKPVPFDQFVKRYLEYSKGNKKSWTRDVTSSIALLRFYSGKSLNQITSWSVESYKVNRQKEITHYRKPPCKATINRELACLKHMFTKAVDWGIISSNPVTNVRLFPERPQKLRILSNEEFSRLYNDSSATIKPILTIAMNTGMRRGEILGLKWDDVNMKERFIYVRDSKNNESRDIPINDVLMETLESVKNNSNSKYVLDRNGNPIKSFKKGFYSALRRSGIKKCRFHDLRHTFATRLIMARVDIVTVQELLGHKDIRMTKRYSHPTPEHKKQAVDMLNSSYIGTYLDTSRATKTNERVVSV